MKAEIIITGQVSGNFHLLGKMHNYSELQKSYANFTLKYNTKKQAQADLESAWKAIKRDESEYCKKDGSYIVRHNKRATALIYDASKAAIV